MLFRPWLDASIITLSTLLMYSFSKICPNCNEFIVVFDKSILILLDLTPKVPIDATFFLFKLSI